MSTSVDRALSAIADVLQGLPPAERAQVIDRLQASLSKTASRSGKRGPSNAHRILAVGKAGTDEHPRGFCGCPYCVNGRGRAA